MTRESASSQESTPGAEGVQDNTCRDGVFGLTNYRRYHEHKFVTLSLERLEYCLWLARRRDKKKKAKADVVAPGRTSQQVHNQGLYGEVAVADYLGLKVNEEFYEWGDRRNPGDLQLPNGQWIECKWRSRNGPFSTNRDNPEEIRADYGALVWPGLSIAEQVIVGYWNQETWREHRQRIYWRKWCWAINSGYMRDIDELHERSQDALPQQENG